MPPKRQAVGRGGKRGGRVTEKTKSNLSRASTESHHRDSAHGHKDRKHEQKAQKRAEQSTKPDPEEKSPVDAEHANSPREGEKKTDSRAHTPVQDEIPQDGKERADTGDGQEAERTEKERWAEAQGDPTDADVESNAGDKNADDDWEIRSVSPEEFDSKSFATMLGGFSQEFQNADFDDIDSELEAEKIRRLILNVSVVLNNFKNYSLHSQTQIHSLREEIRQAKSKLNTSIKKRGYDLKAAENTVPRDHNQEEAVVAKSRDVLKLRRAGSQNERELSTEERELQYTLRKLNVEIAAAGEELAKANKYAVETQNAAVQAALAAKQAEEDAKRIQLEIEAKTRADELRRKREAEQKRKEEEEAREAARSRAEEDKRREEERRKISDEKHKHKTPDWESWPVFTYHVEQGENDQGIGCIVRGDPNVFRENSIECQVIRQLDTSFTYNDNEELVSNIVQISSTGDDSLKRPIYVALPHCISRASAMTREPIIKAEIDGEWVELASQEVTFDNHKDLKFVQAGVRQYTKLAVVTQFKRDYTHFSRRGGRVTSSVDGRVTFTAPPNAFKKSEHIVMQLQPVDSASVHDLKARKPACKGLLTSSSIISIRWKSEQFERPLQVTLPCPPNPVKAKKAAAIRAAKEARRKNPQATRQQNILDPPPEAVKTEEEKKPVRTDGAARWYMGIYGNNDDDENDLLYMVTQDQKGKWSVYDNVNIASVKLDLLQFELHEPINRFMVLRTRTNVSSREAQQMATVIENYLSQRNAQVVLKQRGDDLCDMVLHIVPPAKSNKVVQKLSESGFSDGPAASSEMTLKEGDVLEIAFRGNIKNVESKEIVFPYNSQLSNESGFYCTEVDKFLQKSYSLYRGFVQILKVTTKIHPPPAPSAEDLENEDYVQPEPTVEVIKDLITELLVSIPKEETSPRVQTPPPKASVRIRNNRDPVNEDVLLQIAVDIGDEWQKVAYHLNVRRDRIQAILRNNQYSERREEDCKYDMLMTWAKRVPRGMNKVKILCKALSRSGRYDLAEQLIDLHNDYKQTRAASARSARVY